MVSQLQETGCLCEELLSSLRVDTGVRTDGFGGLAEVFQNLKDWCVRHKDLIANIMFACGTVLQMQRNPYCNVGAALLNQAGGYLKQTEFPLQRQLSAPAEPKRLTYNRFAFKSTCLHAAVT